MTHKLILPRVDKLTGKGEASETLDDDGGYLLVAYQRLYSFRAAAESADLPCHPAVLSVVVADGSDTPRLVNILYRAARIVKDRGGDSRPLLRLCHLSALTAADLSAAVAELGVAMGTPGPTKHQPKKTAKAGTWDEAVARYIDEHRKEWNKFHDASRSGDTALARELYKTLFSPTVIAAAVGCKSRGTIAKTPTYICQAKNLYNKK